MKKTLAIVATLGVLATSAWAEENFDCEIIEVEASTAAGPSMDKTIPKPLQKLLTSPQYSKWNTFKQQTSHKAKLAPRRAATFELSGKRKLTTVLKGHTDLPGKKRRLSVSLTIDDAKKTRLLDTRIEVDEGRHFLLTRNSGSILSVHCEMAK